jgi:hypothetical protein
MPDYQKIAKVVIAFLFCIALNACSGTATVKPETASALPSMPQPTFTITPQPSVTLTAALRLSITPVLRRPTNNFRETLRVALTEQTIVAGTAAATSIPNFPAICDQRFETYDTSISPGGNWLAIACGDESNQTLEIARKDGKRWTLHFKDYLSAENIDQYGTAGKLRPVHWTLDETYLYFTSNSPFDGGGGPCFYGPRIIDLYRINLNNGKVSAVIADTYHFAFSPGGLWLAYIVNQPVILNLRTGEKLTIEVGNDDSGTPRWSPDGSELAYAICQQTPDGNQIVKSAINIYSLTTRTSRTILQLEKSFLKIETLQGDDPNFQRIFYDDYSSGNWNYLFFDWSTKQFVTPKLTPTP